LQEVLNETEKNINAVEAAVENLKVEIVEIPPDPDFQQWLDQVQKEWLDQQERARD
jgi:hypothetical protein